MIEARTTRAGAAGIPPQIIDAIGAESIGHDDLGQDALPSGEAEVRGLAGAEGYLHHVQSPQLHAVDHAPQLVVQDDGPGKLLVLPTCREHGLLGGVENGRCPRSWHRAATRTTRRQ